MDGLELGRRRATRSATTSRSVASPAHARIIELRRTAPLPVRRRLPRLRRRQRHEPRRTRRSRRRTTKTARTVHVAEPLKTVATGTMEIQTNSLTADLRRLVRRRRLLRRPGGVDLRARRRLDDHGPDADRDDALRRRADAEPRREQRHRCRHVARPDPDRLRLRPGERTAASGSAATRSTSATRTTSPGRAARPPCVAGPNSPLVVYGDTSQDGVWYGGHPYDVLGHEFGDKPFDPFTNLPDGENEDDEWVFPLANPYDLRRQRHHRRQRPVRRTLRRDGATCRRVGFTAYGGAGNDLIIGSQAGDHLAGGSGDDTILGQRGVDHIYGDSGVNVNILTRGADDRDRQRQPARRRSTPTTLARATARRSSRCRRPSPTPLDAGRDLIYGDGDAIYGAADGHAGGLHRTEGGVRRHHLRRPRRGHPAGRRPEPAAMRGCRRSRPRRSRRSARSSRASLPERRRRRDLRQPAAATSSIGGAGNDMVDGDEADDLVFGDNVFLLRAACSAPTRRRRSRPDDITSLRFQTLCGTLLYSRTRPADACGIDGRRERDDSGRPAGRRHRRATTATRTAPHRGGPSTRSTSTTTSRHDEFHSFDVDGGIAGRRQLRQRLPRRRRGARPDLRPARQRRDPGRRRHRRRPSRGDDRTSAPRASPDGCTRHGRDATCVCDYVGDLDIVPSFEARDRRRGLHRGRRRQRRHLRRPRPGRHRRRQLRLLQPHRRRTMRPDGDDLHLRRRGHARATGTTTAARPRRRHVRRRPARARRRHDRRRQRPASSASSARTAIDLSAPTATPATPLRHLQLRQRYGATQDRRARRRRCSTTRRAARTSGPTVLRAGHPDRRAAIAAETHDGELLRTPDSRRHARHLERVRRTSAATTRSTASPATTSSTPAAATTSSSATPRTTTSSAAGATTGSPAAPARTASSATTAASSPAATAGCDDGRLPAQRRRRHCFSEPLYGDRRLPGRRPRHRRQTQGNVLNEFIYTPGQVQTATINVGGELKKAVDLTPFNLGAERRRRALRPTPLFDAEQRRRRHLRRLGRRLPARRRRATTRSPAARRSGPTSPTRQRLRPQPTGACCRTA